MKCSQIVLFLGVVLFSVSMAQAQTVELHRQCYAPAGTIQAGNRTLPSYGLAGHLRNSKGQCEDIRTNDALGGGTRYWVDGTRGADSNPGTEVQPFKTIEKAVSTMQRGDKVIIREGTYYVGRIQPPGGSSGNLTGLIGYPGEEVLVSGANVKVGPWTHQGGGVWRASWPLGKLQSPYYDHQRKNYQRREILVYADSTLYDEWNGTGQLDEGEFYLEGTYDNPGPNVYVKLPGGANPNDHTLRTSTEHHVIDDGDCSDEFGGPGYFQFINLDVRHAASSTAVSAFCAGLTGSYLEDIRVSYNNGVGIWFKGNNLTARDINASHNGRYGINGECDNCLFEYHTSYRNGIKAGIDTFGDIGGGKFLNSTGSVWRYAYYHGNVMRGMWFDHENKQNLIEQSLFIDNQGMGLFLEYNTDNNVVINNVLTTSGYGDSAFAGEGIMLSGSSNNLIAYNTFMLNASGGVRMKNRSNGCSRNNGVYNNLNINNMQSGHSSERKITCPTTADMQSNSGDGNAYWSYSSGPATFYSSNPSVSSHSLADWRAAHGEEANSFIANMAQPHVIDVTNPKNGWMLVENSQYRGRAVAIPRSDIPDWYASAYDDYIKTDYFGNARAASGGDIGAHEFAATGGKQLPQVSISAPSSGVQGMVGVTLHITATASAADGTISRVEFFKGETRLGVDTTSPYEYAWTPDAEGTYELTAVATDNDGHAVTSEPVSVVITKAVEPTLLAAYDFVQGSDPQVLYDRSGGGHHARLGSSTTADAADPSWSPEGLTFDGNDDFAELTDGLITSYPFTLEVYARSATHGGNALLSLADAAAHDAYVTVQARDGAATLIARNPSLYEVRGTTAPEAGSYHHYTAVFHSPTHRELWLDGVKVATDDREVALVAATRLSVGRVGDRSPGGYTSGTIAYARVYNHALDATEIQAANDEVRAIVEARRSTTEAKTRHEIPLQQGWNLISSYVEPEDGTLPVLLADVLPNVVVVKDQEGKVFMPAFSVDGIGTWDATQAYLLYMNVADTLVINGAPLQPKNNPLPLQEGWNSVAYLGTAAMDAETAFSDIATELVLVKDGEGNLYYPASGVDTLSPVQVGQGYKIYVQGTTTLIYPADDSGSMKSQAPTRDLMSGSGTD